MVSLYFNVFSSLSLSNLLPRVQLSNLINNQNQNSFLNRFGLQDTVTDLLNRVGFDQTFSVGNKIGIDRPDSVLNKVELGMNNVINVNQQGLLNPGQSGVGGLYGGNGPGQFPGGTGGGISGVGTYGGQAGVAGGGGGLLGTQGGWQGSAQGSFPIGGGNRPAPPGAYPDAQYGGGGVPLDSGGGIGNGQPYGNSGVSQTGSPSGGGLLSGIFNQMGNRFGWGSSNKNDPKDYKQSGGGLSHSWWMNQEDSQEYWLQESLRNAIDDGRTADTSSDTVLKYLVESQIKKLVSSMLQHLDEAKARPEEQLKLNEAAQEELRKLTSDQIKRIAHDIVEREKSKLNELNKQNNQLRNPGGLSEADLKQLLVESTRENDIRIGRDEIAQLLEMVPKQNTKDQEKEANKTTMNRVVQQLNVKPKQSLLRLEEDLASIPEENSTSWNTTEEVESNITRTVVEAVRNKTTAKEKLETTSLVVPNIPNPTVEKPSDKPDAVVVSRPQLYISEQMMKTINELLQQLAGQSGNNRTESSTIDSNGITKLVEAPMTTAKFTTTAATTTTATEKTSSAFNDTSQVEASKEDDVKALLQRLFGNTNDEALKPFLPQQLVRKVPETSPSSRSNEGNFHDRRRSFTRRFNKDAVLDHLRSKVQKRNSTVSGSIITNKAPLPKNHNVLSKGNAIISGSKENEKSEDLNRSKEDLPSVEVGMGHSDDSVHRKQHKKRGLMLQPPTFPSRWFKRNLPNKLSLSSSKH